jgi:O-antigen/teichoic acid export membrane protein
MSLHPPADAPDGIARDTAIALKNAAKLGASLVVTWGVALAVRLYLPRHLGPELIGVLSFAEGFSATFFIVLGMGVDMYIQKVVPVRPEHASDFFGGVVAVRLLLSTGMFLVMAAVMALAGRSAAVQAVVFVYGLAYVLSSINGSLAALLHASRKIDGLAAVNIGSKLVWGAGLAAALALRLGLVGLAGAFLASEALRTAALSALARRHVGLRLRLDLAAVKLVVLASLPIYVNNVANNVYAKVDVTLISFLASDIEVGWYGTAANLASLALLVSPLVSWVLLPLLSRAAARSQEELFSILRRAVLVVLLLVLPVSLMMGIGADVWVPALFGEAFVPSIRTLRILSPVFVCTYMAMISATCLVLLDRAWTVAGISLGALVLAPTLDLLLVPWCLRALGPGGAGVGAAIALLVTEASVMVALTAAVGRKAFSRRSALVIGKVVLACAAVVGADVAWRSIGPARLALDMALYLALLLGLRAVSPSEIAGLTRFLRSGSWRDAHVQGAPGGT